MNDHSSLQDLQTAIKSFPELVVLTGSGISAESGIPTFREAQTGLWAQYDPQELATPQAFQDHPRTVLQWYQWRRSLIRKADPNPAHKALAILEEKAQSRGQKFTLITQNIDHLHQEAGSKNVLELHGNIFRHKCARCQQPADSPLPEIEANSPLPRCPACDGIYRPDVVWFGEGLPGDKLQRAFAVSKTSDGFFSIGTSAVVQPAASLPVIASEHGATLIEINPNPTPLSPRADFVFRTSAANILPDLVRG